MSKIENIVTGERMMTKGNALRHYIAIDRRVIKSGDSSRMKEIWNESAKQIDSSLCFGCIHDDIGYCGLRKNANINEEEKFVQYCFPSAVKWWEEQLNEILGKKGRRK